MIENRGGLRPLHYRLPEGRIVRRARDWRLYDQAGDRYTDFWQADGAAFLGHRPRGLARTVSAEIDRGLWAPVPTAWEARLERVLLRLAHRAGVVALTTAPAPRRWRPLDDVSENDGTCREVHRVVLPFPAAFVRDAMEHSMSPVVLSGLVVAAEALLRYLESPEAQQRLALARALPVPPGYEQRGVYWVPAGDRPEYARFRRRAWSLGIVLPPDEDGAMCCPGELSRRERRNWEVLCSDRSE